jgi:hypothetical protein
MSLKMTQKTVNHVISLGSNCQTSMYFKNTSYKRFSGPFDWLAADDIHILDNILATNFANFLNKDCFVDHLDKTDRKCGHSIYGSRFFHHYNPRNKETYAYYQRCVERFRSLSKCGQGTFLCLLMISYEPEDGMLERIHENLKKHVPMEQLEFLVCIVTPNSPSYSSTYERITQSFAIWRLHILTHTNGTQFASFFDNLYFHQTLHKHYTFDIKEYPFTDIPSLNQYEKAAAFNISI